MFSMYVLIQSMVYDHNSNLRFDKYIETNTPSWSTSLNQHMRRLM